MVASVKGKQVKTKSFIPIKRRTKRKIQREAARTRSLEFARKARKAHQAKRKRLEKTGVLYTPPDQQVAKVRRGQQSIKANTTFEEIIKMPVKAAYYKLVSVGYLRDPKVAKCPMCKKKLGKVIFRKRRHPSQRCRHKACGGQRWIKTTSGTWADHEVPLNKLGAVAWLHSGQLSKRPGADDCALLTDVGHTVCQSISNSFLNTIHKQHNAEQIRIKLEGQCEADATTIRVIRLRNGRLLHVRVLGFSRRGDHTRTIAYMMPSYTTPPGGKTRPESTDETEPLMQRHMRNPSKVIWHTDGARCYRHHKNNTRVKHSRRVYASARKVELSNGDVLMCYGGTQLQDGLWKHLGDHVPGNMNTGSDKMQKQLAKWVAYWAWRFRRASCLDMFAELGATVAAVRKD
jgi:hypothetical protein